MPLTVVLDFLTRQDVMACCYSFAKSLKMKLFSKLGSA